MRIKLSCGHLIQICQAVVALGLVVVSAGCRSSPTGSPADPQGQGTTAPTAEAPRGPFVIGLDHVRQGEIDEAIRVFQAIVARDPHQVRARVNLDTLQDVKGGTIPAEVAVHLLAGRTAAARKQYSQAIEQMQAALAIAPQYCRIQVDLGNTHSLEGKPESALAAYAEAQQLDPGCSDLQYNRGVFLHLRGQLPAAVEAFGKAIEQADDDPIAYFGRGNAHAASGAFELAERDLSRAIELEPRMTVAYLSRASVLHNQGQLERAVADYRQAMSLDSQQTAAIHGLAVTLEAMGKHDAAIRAYEEFIARAGDLDPDVTAEVNRRIDAIRERKGSSG